MINLYFGSPCDDWANETVELYAINYNVSMQRANFIMFQELLETLSERKDGHSYLDDRFGWTYKRLVYAPEISIKQYSDKGELYPMVSLAKNYVIHKTLGDRLPITEEALTIFGKDFEETFGFEYLGYKWSGRQRWLNLEQVELF